MAPRRPTRASAFRRAAVATGLVLFTVVVLFIFALTFLVQGGAIKLPQWAKSLDQGPPETRAEQAGAMVACVIVLFVLFFCWASYQLVKEARMGR